MKPSNGKIARLPADLRDRVCIMIRDNVPYNTIIEKLGQPVHHITEQNFTNWKNNGYKQWLEQQEQIDLLQKASNLALAAATSNKAMVVHQASLHLVATQLKEALIDLDTEAIRQALQGDPENFTRIVNAIARLSEGGLRFERYHAEVARNKAIIEKELNAAKETGGLTPQSIVKMQRALNMM